MLACTFGDCREGHILRCLGRVLGQEPVCFMLLAKTAAGSELLEKIQEQTGLTFHVGF